MKGESYLALMIEQRTGVSECVRCEGRHDQLDWKRFAVPVAVSEVEQYTAWATCPTSGDPIMFAVQSLPEVQQ